MQIYFSGESSSFEVANLCASPETQDFSVFLNDEKNDHSYFLLSPGAARRLARQLIDAAELIEVAERDGS